MNVASNVAAERETLVTLFEAQAAARPHDIAISFGGSRMSYQQLDRRADQAAEALAALGVGPGAVVGLCLPRSLDLIVGMLAILKAGAAYLPLDPAYPADRLLFMVEDAGADVVVSAPPCSEWVPDMCRLMHLNEIGEAPSARPWVGSTRSAAKAGDLAYVIYTSGSTGRPKGVAIEHAAALRLFTATQPWFAFGPGDVWTLFHSVSFDFSVWEIWGALLYGGRLVIVPETTTRDPKGFLQLLTAERVTVLNQTPSAFGALDRADACRQDGQKLALRTIIFGGEPLDPRRLAGWYGRHGESARLVNMYGITETTVHVTYRPLSPADASRSGSPIGIPIPDLEIHLLDAETLMPVAPGEVGEIFVAGAGLARGYLNRPELTAARFISHPHASGRRLYKSGDLGRRLDDGGYEHLGRADQQIKIRGFRVEPGEIEAALTSHPAIAQAAVVLGHGSGGAARLVGYVVAGRPDAPAVAALRAHVARILPPHMVPSSFVFLPELPLTVNGKLDRAALPPPARTRPETAAPYCAPRDGVEQRLVAVLADVLQIEDVGIDDNLFDLGGNSLLVAELHGRLIAQDAPGLKLVDLYRFPNVRALAREIGRNGRSGQDSLAASLGKARKRGFRASGTSVLAETGSADLAAG